jgi:hypothetical protein
VDQIALLRLLAAKGCDMTRDCHDRAIVISRRFRGEAHDSGVFLISA